MVCETVVRWDGGTVSCSALIMEGEGDCVCDLCGYLVVSSTEADDVRNRWGSVSLLAHCLRRLSREAPYRKVVLGSIEQEIVTACVLYVCIVYSIHLECRKTGLCVRHSDIPIMQ